MAALHLLLELLPSQDLQKTRPLTLSSTSHLKCTYGISLKIPRRLILVFTQLGVHAAPRSDDNMPSAFYS